ncbi:transcriptional repressor TraM domain-containing protein (plasmid) [Rhizobium sp. CIAT894]|nr:transcriptional repressor TraM domain-containing protein [Rhizobium sp. CIAT894]
MTSDAPTSEDKLEMRPVYGLTQGLPKADRESLTVDTIRTHRCLVDEADRLFRHFQKIKMPARRPANFNTSHPSIQEDHRLA